MNEWISTARSLYLITQMASLIVLTGCSVIPVTRENEAGNLVGAIVRSQQAYYLENQRFSRSIDALDLGLPEETDRYIYAIVADDRLVSVTAVPKLDLHRHPRSIVCSDLQPLSLVVNVSICVGAKINNIDF